MCVCVCLLLHVHLLKSCRNVNTNYKLHIPVCFVCVCVPKHESGCVCECVLQPKANICVLKGGEAASFPPQSPYVSHLSIHIHEAFLRFQRRRRRKKKIRAKKKKEREIKRKRVYYSPQRRQIRELACFTTSPG